jgi:hypothetical protein
MGDSDSDSDAELTTRNNRSINTRGRADIDSSSEDESSSDDDTAPATTRAQSRMQARSVAFGLTEDVEDSSQLGPAPVTWREVVLNYRYSGSVAQLRADPEAAKLALQNEEANVFGDWQGERTKNHICGGVEIVGLKSDFPVSLQIYAEGAAGEEARRSVSADGTRGAFTAWPNMEFHDDGDGAVALIARNSEADKHPFLEKYPGWNLDNLETGITHISEQKSVIRNDHPLIGVFNKARVSTGKTALTAKDEAPAGFFTAVRRDVEPTLERLKSTMTDKLQIQDLHNLSVRFARAFGAQAGGAPEWDDPAELYDGLSNARSKQGALEEPRSLYVKLRVRYRVI